MISVRWTILVGAIGATLALSTATAEAKCAFRSSRVEVEFRSHTGEPVSGVTLAVFANGSDNEMGLNKAAQNDATSREGGRFVRTYLFNSYSGPGFFVADRCNARVRSLELIANHQNYRAKRMSIKKVRHSAKAIGELETIVISALLMDPLEP